MINNSFLSLQGNYLFSDIKKRVREYTAAHPNADIINLSIGDVTRPLPEACVRAIHSAAEEMKNPDTFRGYPPERGESFLIEKIIEHDFHRRDIDIAADEIFISDGAKSDTGNISDIFSPDCTVALCDPMYPVYADSNIIAGRAGKRLKNGRYSDFIYIDCTAENGFIPSPPKERANIVYLCSPNNPTGVAMSRDELEAWVVWALDNGCVILFDAAYEAYITEDIPHSIYEIDGAKECAVEFRSFSKTAGFTGLRCAYTVVPKALKCSSVSLNSLWARRQATKFNGVSYITQRAAEAVYSDCGRRQVRENTEYYLKNAKAISDVLKSIGFSCYGGKNSPYVWFKAQNGLTSFELFERLLNRGCIVGTPGNGFGLMGEGYFRLTGFASAERTAEAIERIKNSLI